MIRRKKDLLITRDVWPLRDFLDVYDWNAIQIEAGRDRTDREDGLEPFHSMITGMAITDPVSNLIKSKLRIVI